MLDNRSYYLVRIKMQSRYKFELFLFMRLTLKLCGANEVQRSLRPNERFVSGTLKSLNSILSLNYLNVHLAQREIQDSLNV